MKRNYSVPDETQLPDAINYSRSKDFTIIPNDFIHNPEISSIAKTILCILLSNKKGWHSYLTTLQTFIKEKNKDTLQKYLRELEDLGYLKRIHYRQKFTKQIVGTFWAYTDDPNTFDISKNLKILESNNWEVFEPQPKNPVMATKPITQISGTGFSGDGKIASNNTNINNTNIKNTNDNFSSKNISSSFDDKKNKKIVPSQFDLFWEIYPKKSSKGKALTSWNNICTRKNHKPPTWEEIKTAIEEQIKSERWQRKQFIPLPATWLNQFRWLDDPKEMIDYDKHDSFSSNNPSNTLSKYRKPTNGSRQFGNVEKKYASVPVKNISNTKN